MKNEKQSLVFFGSGPVAAESLKLLAREFTIEAVVTKATTKRDMQAVAKDSEVFTVSDKHELDAIFATNKFKSSVGILIDFGIIVSNKIIEYFPMGIINSHFSLLPELRGADPISFAILEGKEKTGVTLMLLVEAMDEGPVIAIGEEYLDGTETAQVLTEKLIQLSFVLLVDTIPTYLSGKSVPIEQTLLSEKMRTKQSYTRKLTKEDGIIDWSKPAIQIEREIRAYQEWPKSHTNIGNFDCVITKATVLKKSGKPGELFIDDKKIAIYCGQDALQIESLKPSGKKEMPAESFLAGYSSRL